MKRFRQGTFATLAGTSASRTVTVSLAFLATTAALATGCGSCGKATDGGAEAGPSAIKVAQEPPVPAPEQLLAEVVVASPNAFWKRAQTGMGGAIAILPDTFAGLACAAAGLDPPVAREVDAAAAAYAVVAEGEGGAIAYALALKLADVAHTQTILVDAETAPFKATETNAIRVLASKALPLPMAVGVARSGWLLIASTDSDLVRLGPYAYRTLPTRAVGTTAVTIDVPRSALAGPLRARVAGAWGGAKGWLLQHDADERKNHGGRAPDFGDATAIVGCLDGAVERRLAVAADLDALRIEVEASDDDVHAVATLKPAEGGGPATQRFAAMHPGTATPLLDAPADATLAWMVRDDAAERASDAHDIENCIEGALGKRLGDDDAKRLRTLADAWTKSRGDWLLVSAMWGGARGLGVRGPTTDADAAGRALRDAVELGRRPAFAEPLKGLLRVRDITVGTADAPPLGKVNVATLVREEPKTENRRKLAPPLPLGWAWTVGGGEVSLALGESPPSLLVAMTKPNAKLGADPRLARAVVAFEANATFALIAQAPSPPPRAAQPGGPPFALAWGRRGTSGWSRVEIGYVMLRELLRNFISL